MSSNKFALSLVGLILIAVMTTSASACVLNGYGKVTGGGHGRIPDSPGIPGGSFGFNIMYYEGYPAPKGELQYKDHATGMNVHCHTMTHLEVSEDKTWAWFAGECTIDGADGFTFTAYVEDNGEPGKNDFFKIKLFDDGVNIYSAGNGLLCGNIQIHAK